jgi:hypothetical protein
MSIKKYKKILMTIIKEGHESKKVYICPIKPEKRILT